MQRAESKVPFLPNVITPQLGLMIQGVGHKLGGHAHHPVKGRGRLQPLVVSLTPTSPIAKMLPTLSNINEDNESGSFDKTLTKSFHDLGSKDSTLKDESRSDFETDSLERHGVIIGGDMSVGTMIPSHTHSHSPSGPGGGAVPVIGYVQMLPSPHHHQQQQLHGGPHQLPSQSNLVVNYAVQDGSLPLSPIWNQMQFLRTDSETSSNSEYITSYIGRLTPLPHVQAPDPASRKFGADSGHGESSDEDRDGESSDGSGSEGEELQEQDQQEDNCLKWKRGRLLGKGAYGKVWEGLMNSAKMIAVKEVELDNESAERAQSVSLFIQQSCQGYAQKFRRLIFCNQSQCECYSHLHLHNHVFSAFTRLIVTTYICTCTCKVFLLQTSIHLMGIHASYYELHISLSFSKYSNMRRFKLKLKFYEV